MVKEKRLVDKVLDNLYEKNTNTCDIKTIFTPDGPSPVRLHGLPKIGKALVDGLPIIGQLHLKLAFQHIKLEKVF